MKEIAKESMYPEVSGEVLVREATSQKVVDQIDLVEENDAAESLHCSTDSMHQLCHCFCQECAIHPLQYVNSK